MTLNLTQSQVKGLTPALTLLITLTLAITLTLTLAQMYAWSVASSQSERGPLDYQLKEEFMLQPPFDMTLDRVWVRVSLTLTRP